MTIRSDMAAHLSDHETIGLVAPSVCCYDETMTATEGMEYL